MTARIISNLPTTESYLQAVILVSSTPKQSHDYIHLILLCAQNCIQTR